MHVRLQPEVDRQTAHAFRYNLAKLWNILKFKKCALPELMKFMTSSLKTQPQFTVPNWLGGWPGVVDWGSAKNLHTVDAIKNSNITRQISLNSLCSKEYDTDP